MHEATYRGSCLCGAVAFEVEGEPLFFHYCHCSRCRRSTGSAHSANLMVRRERFRWVRGEELVGRFELPEARYFCTGWCTACGSSLPWVSRNGRYVVVPAGALEGDPPARPTESIHWASRAPWYVPVAELPRHDAEPGR